MSGIEQTRLQALISEHLLSSFPALSICVIHRGEVTLCDAWGWLDPDTGKQPARPDSLFDLASVSKLFVETAFLCLVEAGEITLDSRLADVIPEFASSGPRPISGGQDPHTRAFLPVEARFRGQKVDPRAVTFRHLLTHTSGLPPWRAVYLLAGSAPPAPPTAKTRYEEERWRKGLAAMCASPFAGTVGDTIRYSDIGIMLLGEAVARLAGCRLDTAIRDLILRPLLLDSITYNPLLNGVQRADTLPTEQDDHWRGRRAWGEVHDENACGVGGIAGHAGLFATARDIARFGQAWLAGDRRLPIGAALRQLATSEHASGNWRLGLGWMLKSAADSSAGDRYSANSYGHTGFTGTSLWIDPARQLVSAALTNRVYYGREPAGIHRFRRALHDLIAEGSDKR